VALAIRSTAVTLVLQVIAARYGVLLEKAGIALRGLFIINPEGIIQQITINDLVSEGGHQPSAISLPLPG
jgi:peroxiredoxin